MHLMTNWTAKLKKEYSPPVTSLTWEMTMLRRMERILLAVSIILIVQLVTALVVAQVPSNTRQILLVTTKDWDAVEGSAQRLELQGTKFQKVGLPFPVVVGTTGLAWGLGLQPADLFVADGPVKKEGDKKSPAGVFDLPNAFGYAAEPPRQTLLPYFPVTNASECVDDSNSRHYNEILDGSKLTRDWVSSESMLRNDNLYQWGIFVSHNSRPAKPGAGSCIFLHIWEGPKQGTVGCTAMQEKNIRMLLGWLDPRKKPILVQLPEGQYAKLRVKWQLP
jgi:L,D-peptidoglycan transpeptidase YkuD (ErfK/YbiS/YcfS/YnhG family)